MYKFDKMFILKFQINFYRKRMFCTYDHLAYLLERLYWSKNSLSGVTYTLKIEIFIHTKIAVIILQFEQCGFIIQ